ncbi:MAG: tetratricopeptide repeat protein [Chloroflexi bacterium]|nr:MAG: tetratricopeptide repeat protein [Chloroflexota bacterium]
MANVTTLADRLNFGFQYHQAGQLEQAEWQYMQVLTGYPDCAEALHLMGLLKHQSGHPNQALDYLRRAIRADGASPIYHSSIGMVYQSLQQFDQAVQSYQTALQLNPNDAGDHYNLAVTLVSAGQANAAIKHFQAAIQLQPNFIEAHYGLGLALKQLGRWAEATAQFHQTLQINPQFGDAYLQLGDTLREQGQMDGAEACYQTASQLHPNQVEPHHKLGLVYLKTGAFAKAEASLKRVIALQPNHAQAHNDLGAACWQQRRVDDAIAHYRQALLLSPNLAEAYNNLGVAYQSQGRFAEAVDTLRQAIRLDPTAAGTHYNLAVLLARQDKIGEAAECYRQALALEPDNLLWQLEMDTLCPAIMPNKAAIDRWRAQLDAALKNYAPGSINLADWLPQLAAGNAYPTWHLAYHGRNERPFRQTYARLFQTAETPPARHRVKAGAAGPYRVGFLVTERHEHIFLSLTKGLLNHFSAPDLHISVICPPASVPKIQAALTNPRIDFVTLPPDLAQAVAAVKSAGFDLIYYWEVGSDSANYFLPFFRLAAVQVTSWGTPTTTGIPQMDMYLSSSLLEGDGAEAHYSEKLVILPVLPTCFQRPALPSPLKPRSALGLADGDHIYLCVQNLLKIHPDFDSILAQILQRDPQGRLVLLNTDVQLWSEKLLARFRAGMPNVVHRVQFLPRLPAADFLNLIAVADVVLDTVHYSGGNTAHEALAVGTPIVTLPGEFARSRLTLARYKAMGVMDCVATNPPDYVNIALRLGTDPRYRNAIKSKILAANSVLFDDLQAVRAMENFFRQAIQTAGNH